MAKYLISFPSAAMVVPDGEWEAVGRDAHAVIDEAKAAGVYVFGGGIDEDVPPVLVSADGAVADGGYPWAPKLDGGVTVLELPSREEPSRGPRVSRRPAAATRNCASSSSIRSPEGRWRGSWRTALRSVVASLGSFSASCYSPIACWLAPTFT
ncbi:MAG TPA: hypothetical protein VHF86_08585 [Xanthomonadaceae bacterium]|nr:hypothetical protein [Xanthomonadaceae bacterium]